MTARSRICQIIAAAALLTMSAIPAAVAEAPSTLPTLQANPAYGNGPDVWFIHGFGCIGTGGTLGEVTVAFTDKNGAQVGSPVTVQNDSLGDWHAYVTLDRSGGDYIAHATCDLYNTSVAYPALTVPASSFPVDAAGGNLLAGNDTLTAKVAYYAKVDNNMGGDRYIELTGTGCAVDEFPGKVTATATRPNVPTQSTDIWRVSPPLGSWSWRYTPADLGHYHFEAVCAVNGDSASYQSLDFDLVLNSDGTAVIVFAGATDPAAATRTLADTGTNTVALVPYAGLLLALGLGLVWVGRRRHLDH